MVLSIIYIISAVEGIRGTDDIWKEIRLRAQWLLSYKKSHPMLGN